MTPSRAINREGQGGKALPTLGVLLFPGKETGSSTDPGCSGPSPKLFSCIDKGRQYDSTPVCANDFGNSPGGGCSGSALAQQSPAKCGPDHAILYKRAVKLLDNAEKKLTAGYTAEAKSQAKEANSLFTILQKECGPAAEGSAPDGSRDPAGGHQPEAGRG